MTVCPIFQTFHAAKLASIELESLRDEIISRLKKAEPDVFKKADDSDEESDEALAWVWLGTTYKVPTTLREKSAKKARSRILSIRFDLYREVSNTLAPWKHALDALLIIGFWPLKEGSWTNAELCVTADGRLQDSEAWEQCRKHRHADGRLLEWANAGDGPSWAQRGWIFAVPIRSFSDPKSVDKHLVHPLVGLLTKGKDPKIVLGGTDAIVWSAAK